MILWYYLSFIYSADKASYKWQYSRTCYLHTVLTKPRISGNMINQYYRLTAWIIEVLYKRTFICTPILFVKASYVHSTMCILIILRKESISCKRESIRCRRESIQCKRESIRCRNRAVRPRFWWQRKIPTENNIVRCEVTDAERKVSDAKGKVSDAKGNVSDARPVP